MPSFPGMLLIFGFCLLPGDAASAAQGNAFSVGYAEVEITPPLGVTMPGYFQERKSTGVLDPLLAKAVALQRGETTLLIITLDLLGVEQPVVQRIRAAVQAKTGVPPERIFVHSTHTHTGATIEEIQDALPAQVAEAAGKAAANLKEENDAVLGAATEESVAFIRRYLMADGTVKTNPGRVNPNIVHPMGTIDPTVNLLAFNGAKIMLVSYGLHPDCIGGTLFSADYPYHLTTGVKEILGEDWNVLYLNACCGNVNHINVNDPNQKSSYEESRRIGKTLAQAVLRAVQHAVPLVIDALDSRTVQVDCPIRRVPDEIYAWAKEELQANPAEASKRKFNEYTPSGVIELAETKETCRPAEIIVFRIGPIGLVGLPAESFVELARDIQLHSLLHPTWVIGLTGGSMGYMPHPRGYDEGGYEASFSSARYAPETPVRWCDAAIRLLNALHAGDS